MAGAGVRLFTAGSILTAQQVNEYLMDQTISRFSDSAARDSSFGGLGEPVLSEGRLAYLDSDNKLYVYDGSNWVELALSIFGTSAQVIVYDSSGAPTARTLSGDVTINSTGVTTIDSDKVTTAKIADSSVTTAKIADSNITTAKIADGTVTSAKIADGTIVNADISANAAIEIGKIADATIAMKTANYSLVLSDKNKFIKMSSESSRTITVPLQATVDFPEGAQIHLVRYGSGTLEIVGESNEVYIYATPGKFLRARYSSATLLKCADTNAWLLIGDLSES